MFIHRHHNVNTVIWVQFFWPQLFINGVSNGFSWTWNLYPHHSYDFDDRSLAELLLLTKMSCDVVSAIVPFGSSRARHVAPPSLFEVWVYRWSRLRITKTWPPCAWRNVWSNELFQETFRPVAQQNNRYSTYLTSQLLMIYLYHCSLSILVWILRVVLNFYGGNNLLKIGFLGKDSIDLEYF